jgi:transcription termination factor Rho
MTDTLQSSSQVQHSEQEAPKSPKPQERSGPQAIKVEGVLEAGKKCFHLLDPKRQGKTSPLDPLLHQDMAMRFKLKAGSFIVGEAYLEGRYGPAKIKFIHTVDGLTLDEHRRKFSFNQLTSLTPNKQLRLELDADKMTTRIVDLFCPIGKGQRALIVAPPRAGKTTLLQDIAQGIQKNHPECHLIIVLVDERPEEVTDFQRSVQAELYASSNDETPQNHMRVAELAIERAKRLVEAGKDVVLILDSITRLARAYNLSNNSGKTMTGGLDVRALEKPRQLFAAARNTEEGGSLTIIASALVETGSKMDDLIFQEFKGTGNMEMVLDRKLAELRLWPAINFAASGTRKEELLLEPEVLKKVQFYRRAIAGMKPDDATETTLQRLGSTTTNQEFLSRMQLK